MSKKDASTSVAVTPLIPVGAYTATETGDRMDWSKMLPQKVMAVLDYEPSGDADETVVATVEGTNDGGDNYTVVATFTIALGDGPHVTAYKNISQPIFREYRGKLTIAGATPVVTAGLYLVGAHPTYAPIEQVTAGV